MNEPASELNRREFFTKGFFGGASALGLGYFANMAKEFYETVTDGWEHEGSRATLDPAPWGGKCTVIYELHGQRNYPQIVGGDILTLEGVFNSARLSDGRLLPSSFINRGKQQLLHEFDHIWMVDVPLLPLLGKSGSRSLFDVGEAILKTYLSALVVKSGASKIATGASLSALFSDYFSDAANLVLKSAGLPRHIEKVNASLPSSVASYALKNLRNIVAAEKNEYLARHFGESHSRAPHLVTNWGRGHAGIESETIASSSDRIKVLRRNLPLLRTFIDTTDPYSWSCVEVTLGSEGQFILGFFEEVPSLKALFTES